MAHARATFGGDISSRTPLYIVGVLSAAGLAVVVHWGRPISLDTIYVVFACVTPLVMGLSLYNSASDDKTRGGAFSLLLMWYVTLFALARLIR